MPIPSTQSGLLREWHDFCLLYKVSPNLLVSLWRNIVAWQLCSRCHVVSVLVIQRSFHRGCECSDKRLDARNGNGTEKKCCSLNHKVLIRGTRMSTDNWFQLHTPKEEIRWQWYFASQEQVYVCILQNKERCRYLRQEDPQLQEIHLNQTISVNLQNQHNFKSVPSKPHKYSSRLVATSIVILSSSRNSSSNRFLSKRKGVSKAIRKLKNKFSIKKDTRKRACQKHRAWRSSTSSGVACEVYWWSEFPWSLWSVHAGYGIRWYHSSKLFVKPDRCVQIWWFLKIADANGFPTPDCVQHQKEILVTDVYDGCLTIDGRPDIFFITNHPLET